jgi:drug/metabolite transporter (DMT)-like permease
MTSSGKFLFVALALIWGIPYLLIKVAMGELTPASLVFLRTALGAVLLLPFVLGRGNLRALVARWRPLLLYTVAELGIPWVLLSDVERRVDSSLAGLMVASVPLVGALLSRLSGGRDRLSGLEVGGLALGFTGVVILLGFNLGAGDPWAILEMLLVVVGYAVGPMVIARRLSDLPVLEVVAASLVICAVAYAPLGIHQLPVHLPSPAVIGSVLGLGALCTAVAFVAFFKLIAEVGPTRATVVTYLNPAVAVLAGVLLLGEPFTVTTALGFVLILAGAWFTTGRGKRGTEPHPEPVLVTEPPVQD